MSKPAIPSTSALPSDIARILEPLKQNVEAITGVRSGSNPLETLSTTATLADVILKINEIIIRLS